MAGVYPLLGAGLAYWLLAAAMGVDSAQSILKYSAEKPKKSPKTAKRLRSCWKLRVHCFNGLGGMEPVYGWGRLFRKLDDFRMKPFLAIDAGAANLKVALFDPQSNGTLTLARYEVVLGQRGLDEPDRTELWETPQELFDRHEIRAKGWNRLCPERQCFTKFLRTSRWKDSRWDRSFSTRLHRKCRFRWMRWSGVSRLWAPPTGRATMLMALREEVIESLSTVCNDLGIRLSVVDGSPAALRNAFMQIMRRWMGVRCCWISAPKPPT